MALPTWIPDALHSEHKNNQQVYWRCVEAQHVISTLKLVDTLDEQQLLEEILEDSKPPVPPECAQLHYLYTTPFRYGLYPHGSRFRRAGETAGVYYVSEHPDTAIIETAFHLLLFYADSPDTPFPTQPSEHSVFDVPVKTTATIDLTKKPFTKAQELWTQLFDYEPCQQLEEMARAQEIELIRYASVRDPKNKINAAILSCRAFANRKPRKFQTWRILINQAGIHAASISDQRRISISPKDWQQDKRLQNLDW